MIIHSKQQIFYIIIFVSIFCHYICLPLIGFVCWLGFTVRQPIYYIYGETNRANKSDVKKKLFNRPISIKTVEFFFQSYIDLAITVYNNMTVSLNFAVIFLCPHIDDSFQRFMVNACELEMCSGEYIFIHPIITLGGRNLFTMEHPLTTEAYKHVILVCVHLYMFKRFFFFFTFLFYLL